MIITLVWLEFELEEGKFVCVSSWLARASDCVLGWKREREREREGEERKRETQVWARLRKPGSENSLKVLNGCQESFDLQTTAQEQQVKTDDL